MHELTPVKGSSLSVWPTKHLELQCKRARSRAYSQNLSHAFRRPMKLSYTVQQLAVVSRADVRGVPSVNASMADPFQNQLCLLQSQVR